ncbi:MAG TPA: UDP-N-acetylmuramate dehydrogenase [Epulopiscium sp.]|nr:UDP-N-acetylmuramate dehydrogenase [Candidatus Epulonipiscium sp.]
MNKNEIAKLLLQKIPESMIKIDEPMKNHTSFKIGGPADIYVAPSTVEELTFTLKVCKDNHIPYFILGNGSNLLVKDGGYRGIMIHILKNMNQISIEGNELYAQAGALLVKVANTCLDHSLTGFEFAHGIPGSIGGAVYMNAGAYGGEMKNVIVSADVIDHNGQLLTLTNEDLALGYRTSKIQTAEMIVVGARIALEQGTYHEIKEKMDDLSNRRRTKQPLTVPSAGSTFKRPEGYYAGKLIMDAELRGFRIGDAGVSDKHCGFIVNLGEATSKEVIDLIRHIQCTVKEAFGQDLHPELKIIGED